MNDAEKAIIRMSGVIMLENSEKVKATMRKMPKESWNSLMADIQGALDDAGKMIPTDVLNKALGKMVGR